MRRKTRTPEALFWAKVRALPVDWSWVAPALEAAYQRGMADGG